MFWQAPGYQVPPEDSEAGGRGHGREELTWARASSATAAAAGATVARYCDYRRAPGSAPFGWQAPATGPLPLRWHTSQARHGRLSPTPGRYLGLYEHPRGLETLTSVERDRAILGNIFADFAFQVAALVADGAASFLAMEQPEDLGALASGAAHCGFSPG